MDLEKNVSMIFHDQIKKDSCKLDLRKVNDKLFRLSQKYNVLLTYKSCF